MHQSFAFNTFGNQQHICQTPEAAKWTEMFSYLQAGQAVSQHDLQQLLVDNTDVSSSSDASHIAKACMCRRQPLNTLLLKKLHASKHRAYIASPSGKRNMLKYHFTGGHHWHYHIQYLYKHTTFSYAVSIF